MDPKKLTGTETEKNLWAAFSGESQAATNTPTLQRLHAKRDITRSPPSLKKPRITKSSTPSFGSNI